MQFGQSLRPPTIARLGRIRIQSWFVYLPLNSGSFDATTAAPSGSLFSASGCGAPSISSPLRAYRSRTSRWIRATPTRATLPASFAGPLTQKEEQLARAATNPAGWSFRPADLTGYYHNPRIGTIEVTQDSAGQLTATWGPNRAPLLPLEQDLFLADFSELEPPVPLRVRYTAEGAVAALLYDGREFRRLPPRVRPADMSPVYDTPREAFARLADGPAATVATELPRLLDRYYPAGVGTEPYFNAWGYRYLRAENYPMALALFQYNVTRYPDSANAHDSLGEAYLATGDRERAAAHYRQSLAIDPDNDNARRALAELERD